jgi:hypothetical protein
LGALLWRARTQNARHPSKLKSSDSGRRQGRFSDKKGRIAATGGRKMRTPLVISMSLLAIALALSGCGVNYHFNPGPRTWPAAPSAPSK